MVTLAAFASLHSLRRAALAGFALASPAIASAQTITSFAPATAASGSTIVITGSNLSGLKSVQMNGQEMRVTGTPTASSVAVIVPQAAATGKIRLTTTAGMVLSSTKLGITRQSSSTNYSQSNSNIANAATNTYTTPTAADLNHDGRIEFIIGQGDGTLLWYEQASANSKNLSAGTPLLTSGGATIDVGYFAAPIVADFDGNGLLELLVGDENGTLVGYEQVASTGTNALRFEQYTQFANPYGVAAHNVLNAGSYARPGVADIDGNGLLDILVGSNDGTLRRYEQRATNSKLEAGFQDWGTLKLANETTALDAGEVAKPLLTDYNGDGYLDLLVGNAAGTMQLYTQRGASATTFQLLSTLSTSGTTASTINVGGYAAPTVTDIDGDGLLDVFVGSTNGAVSRYEQAKSSTTTITAPLPVVLTAFGGQATGAGNQLSWTTAQEINSARFVVEASANGTEFVALAELTAAGTSTTARSYQYLDAAAPALAAARRYYRLRQVDLDGTVAFSPVVTMSRLAAAATPAKAETYPNPFADQLAVALPGSFEPQATTVTLLTLAGRPVYTAKLDLSAAPQALTALPELAAGVYLLRLTTASGSISQKVVRQ